MNNKSIDTKKYVMLVITITLGMLFSIATFSLYVDPYWLWRENPVWLEGQNRVLATKTRFLKALQVLNRKPQAVILGSSRVQVGFNTDNVIEPITYNMGIESLKAYEMRAYINHLIRLTEVDTIVLGLDFFAYINNYKGLPYMEGFDETLGTYKFLPNNIFLSTIGRSTVYDSYRVWIERNQGAHNTTWLGQWNVDDRPGKMIEELGEFMRRESYISSFSSEAIDALEDSILMCLEHNIDLQLFISPIHQEQFKIIEEAGLKDNYDVWHQTIFEMAKKYEITLWDFTQNNPYMASDISQSSIYYLDKSHYRSAIGNVILEQLGFSLELEEKDGNSQVIVIGKQLFP